VKSTLSPSVYIFTIERIGQGYSGQDGLLNLDYAESRMLVKSVLRSRFESKKLKQLRCALLKCVVQSTYFLAASPGKRSQQHRGLAQNNSPIRHKNL
jgi:hypothetical protein